MKWITEQKKEFERDELIILISALNWSYHKPRIKKTLEDIAKSASENGINLIVYDYADNPNGCGFDGLHLQFDIRFTGNMIKKKEKKSTHSNYHRQEGAILAITYSAVGHVHIFARPSESEDLLAVHKDLILYYTFDARTITDKVIKKCVKALFHYHRFTGVMHRITWRDRWAVRWLKTKMYFIEYLEPKERFTRYSGLYIPIVSFIATLASLLIAYLAYNATK